jgi:hypothetical protein
MLNDVLPEISCFSTSKRSSLSGIHRFADVDRKLWDKKAAGLVKDHETAADIYGRLVYMPSLEKLFVYQLAWRFKNGGRSLGLNRFLVRMRKSYSLIC